MRRPGRRLLVPVLVLTLVSAAAACGGDDLDRYPVSSPAMEPTIREGHEVLVKSIDGEPEREDIIIFETPPEADNICPGPGRILFKRLIGLPGDTVEIREGQLLVNDEPVAEPYLNDGEPGEEFGPFPVEDGYFVMGDNRDASCDSRAWGTVPKDYVFGEVVAHEGPAGREEID
jgi:signal peptidase I